MILRSNKLFLRTPRTASTSLKQALLDTGGKQIADAHCRLAEMPIEYTWDNYEIFTVIRNPLDILVSWFTLNPGWKDFRQFIREYNHSYMTDNGLLFYHVPYCHRVFLYERLDEVEDYLSLKLPFLNTTNNKPNYRKMITQSIIDETKKRFSKDLKIYKEFSSDKITTTLEW